MKFSKSSTKPTTTVIPSIQVINKMAGDEKLSSSESNNLCKYCKKNIASTVAKCQKCSLVFHTSCALRIPGLIAVGKDNLVICCATKKSASSTEADFSEISSVYKSLLSAKDEIIAELREKQIILYKNIELLEEKSRNSEKYFKNVNSENVLSQQNVSLQKNVNTADKKEIPNVSKKARDKHRETYSSVINSSKNAGQDTECEHLKRIQQDKMNEIIHLEAEEESQRDGYDDEGFSGYRSRRKRRFYRKRLGNGAVTEEQQRDGFTGADRKAWLYINRVKSHVTADMVKEYILKKPQFETEAIEVKEISLNARNQLKSFLVKAPLERKDELYQPEFWPANVGIKRFSFNLYNKSRPSGDFL